MENLLNQLIKRKIREMQVKSVAILCYSSHNGYYQENQKQTAVRKKPAYNVGDSINWLYQWKSVWEFSFLKRINGAIL